MTGPEFCWLTLEILDRDQAEICLPITPSRLGMEPLLSLVHRVCSFPAAVWLLAVGNLDKKLSKVCILKTTRSVSTGTRTPSNWAHPSNIDAYPYDADISTLTKNNFTLGIYTFLKALNRPLPSKTCPKAAENLHRINQEKGGATVPECDSFFDHRGRCFQVNFALKMLVP